MSTIWLNQRHQHRGGSLCTERGQCGWGGTEPWTGVLVPTLPPAADVSQLNLNLGFSSPVVLE